MLKVGFIGAGGRARSAHYPIVHRLDGVSVEAICELNEDLLKPIADQYKIPRTFTDHREMLEKVDLDVVYCIMHENWLFAPAIDCLNAGKHVMTEKPPGKNTDETQQLLDAAIANDVYCMTAFQRRFSAVTQEAIRLASDRSSPTHIVGTFNKCMIDQSQNGQTTLWDDVCHVVDLIRFLANLSDVVEVTAYQEAFGNDRFQNNGGGRNFYVGMIRFANRSVATVFGNRTAGGRILRSELHALGLSCYMEIPDQIEILEDNRSRRIVKGHEITQTDADDWATYEGVLAMHQHFIDCINNGEIPSSDLRDTIRTMKLVDLLEGTEK